MQTSAGALLAAGLWPGALAAADAPAPDFAFLSMNDLHYIDEKDAPFFKRAVDKLKTASPQAKLLLILGDLVETGDAKAHAAIRDILKTAGLEMKVVIGNHDYLKDAPNDRKSYVELWPDSLNYTFDHAGWQFVALDSSDGTKFEKTAVLQPTLDWLDGMLPKLDKKRPMILITHFPLGEKVTYRPTNAEALLDRFKEYNLKAVFNGHFHGNTEKQRGEILITTGKCCAKSRDNHDGTKEKGFYACKTRDGKVIREFVQVEV